MQMNNSQHFEVIIIGGSYAGLSAAMSLGRFMHQVMVIDSGDPCNWRTPRSQNFLTQDGQAPENILAKAKAQVGKYATVTCRQGRAISAEKTQKGFEVSTEDGQKFTAKKLLFATGVRDILPDIPGFLDCWGISVVHCPYCHGYEHSQLTTAILAQGGVAFEMVKILNQLSKNVTLLSSGPAQLEDGQLKLFKRHHINIIEKNIAAISHHQGRANAIIFDDGSAIPISIIYAAPAFGQHCQLPTGLGCRRLPNGLLKIDNRQQTSIKGVFACGDCTSAMRTIAHAVAAGNISGAMINEEICAENLK